MAILVAHYPFPVAMNGVRRDISRIFIGVVGRFVALPLHTVLYYVFSLDMLDSSFDSFFFPWFLLGLVRPLFITCLGRFVGGLFALIFVHTRHPCYTVDGHRVFDSVLSNFNVLGPTRLMRYGHRRNDRSFL